LRNDAGLQALLPYLIRWVGEGVVTALKEGAQTEADGRSLEVLLDVVSAILENNTLFIEPYVSDTPNPTQSRNLILYSSTNYYQPSFQLFSIPRFRHHMPPTCARLPLRRYLVCLPNIPRLIHPFHHES
jgi:hypothetical protein